MVSDGRGAVAGLDARTRRPDRRRPLGLQTRLRRKLSLPETRSHGAGVVTAGLRGQTRCLAEDRAAKAIESPRDEVSLKQGAAAGLQAGRRQSTGADAPSRARRRHRRTLPLADADQISLAHQGAVLRRRQGQHATTTIARGPSSAAIRHVAPTEPASAPPSNRLAAASRSAAAAAEVPASAL